MKKNNFLIFLFCFFLFEGCFSIPGYVDRDGYITPNYSEEIIIKAVDNTISIYPVETSKGVTNINPTKSEVLRSKKQDTIFLSPGNNYDYVLEGNHSLVLAFRTMAKDATFTISYKGEIKEFTIHSSDLGDKYIYLENY